MDNLIKYLQDPMRSVRQGAIMALGEEPEKYHDVIVEALSNDYWRVRLTSAKVLCENGHTIGLARIFDSMDLWSNNELEQVLSALMKLAELLQESPQEQSSVDAERVVTTLSILVDTKKFHESFTPMLQKAINVWEALKQR